MAGLGAPSKGLIGPWSHAFPDEVEPGPAIGFLQECLRWWDRWLKGEDTGIEDEPLLRAWMQEPVAPAPRHAERPGPLGGRGRLAVAEHRGAAALARRRRARATSPTRTSRRLEISTDLLCGLDSGVWCADGSEGDAAVDQRADDGRALSFTSAPLAERIELLGNARVELELDSDRPVAQIAARLCDVAPDGSSLLVTRGVLNLTHRDSHEHPEPLEPGARTRVVVELDGIAQAVPAGHRLRLALSPAYWPWLWPAPEPVTLGIHTAPSSLVLPVREPRAPRTPSCARSTSPRARRRSRSRPLEPGRGRPHAHARLRERPHRADLRLGHRRPLPARGRGPERRLLGHRRTYSIVPGDPLSAEVRCETATELGRDGWTTRAEVRAVMDADAERFRVRTELEAFENGESVRRREWSFETPRDLG